MGCIFQNKFVSQKQLSKAFSQNKHLKITDNSKGVI